MAYDDKIKTRVKNAYVSSGTVLGTSGIIEGQGYKHVAFATFGSGGSKQVDAYTTFGTTAGTAPTGMAYLVWLGSQISFAGTAGSSTSIWQGGSYIGQQLIFSHGTTAGSFSTNYMLYD